ncbi:TetR/AcrR family transcriptional regulator [Stackebrandtia nassauensis]|uniref:Transcriptional regulator, TetR family n=1 Tax=Stackebrandtia nassauensis (strain DSM 44728 / CIP 108903 / NRRL B-16338 / NBRC 102104 / LLR-40K-21) TaxID=446470 RepID=D3Q6B7_STANL|nr:TetR family transcriptional regulator [Stackebrandtia nassauensis]ADD42292.1 transcriptional regulator, TetR family [Stackebrandtia nassauensis DSM 44728]
MTIGKGKGKRAEKAQRTRAKILTAARDLFVEHGYGTTALQDVADRAEVAVQTIYFTFRNKRTLLKEVVDVAIAGDAEPVATMDRDWFKESLATPTAREQLDIHVDGSRRILERVAPITKVLATAVAMDPEIATMWPQTTDPRYTVQLTAAETLITKPDAQPTLTATRAADLLYCLLSPELFLVFTADRGWPPADWAAWVTTTLRTQLCEPSG